MSNEVLQRASKYYTPCLINFGDGVVKGRVTKLTHIPLQVVTVVVDEGPVSPKFLRKVRCEFSYSDKQYEFSARVLFSGKRLRLFSIGVVQPLGDGTNKGRVPEGVKLTCKLDQYHDLIAPHVAQLDRYQSEELVVSRLSSDRLRIVVPGAKRSLKLSSGMKFPNSTIVVREDTSIRELPVSLLLSSITIKEEVEFGAQLDGEKQRTANLDFAFSEVSQGSEKVIQSIIQRSGFEQFTK